MVNKGDLLAVIDPRPYQDPRWSRHRDSSCIERQSQLKTAQVDLAR